MSLKRKLCRTEAVRNDGERERNLVRGHALFVRFMERKYLGDCVHYFPAAMTLGQLRVTTPRDLMTKYNIRNCRDRDRIMRIIEESHRDNQSSDIDVSICIYKYCVC
jgi:RNA polymerase-interacting CarD/CdnL/TRCF family regulator